jgi:XRE family aerobic/anaerobic benzoate catabolism transcriptional regulator
VWLQADPEDHMKRVPPRATRGRWRPAARPWTTCAILAGRAAFYSKAEFQLDTSAGTATDLHGPGHGAKALELPA